MKTTVIPKIKIEEEIKKGDLIITYKNEVKEFVAIYGGILSFTELQSHIYFPIHPYLHPTNDFRGIKKKCISQRCKF